MIGIFKFEITCDLLYIPEEQERDTIHFLHECRNLLAHASCCSPVQIKKLLESV